jgi:hypothetical protein
MAKIDKKLEQIKLQHEIAGILRMDNGVSCHFDYHINLLLETEGVILNLLTYNEKHDEYMLLHSTKGASSIGCLSKMLSHIKSLSQSKRHYSYTVKWHKKKEEKEHISYFWGSSESEVEKKFLHEKNRENYVFTITQNPVA